MFYGLSKLLKKILPKQLFYRGLLIVATPIIILQITISIVFFDITSELLENLGKWQSNDYDDKLSSILTTPKFDPGILAINIPNPIGTRRRGSYFLDIPRYNKNTEITIIKM